MGERQEIGQQISGGEEGKKFDRREGPETEGENC